MIKCLSLHSNCPLCRRNIYNTSSKNIIKLKKSNNGGYKWTELVNNEGVLVSAVPVWL
jgi:hypothetical protein